MKKLTFLTVATILTISVITVAIVASLTNGFSNANNSINTPTPTATPVPSGVSTANATFSYLEDSKTAVGNNTRLVLSINATLTNGNAVEVDYSKFYLYVWIEGQDGSRGLLNMRHYTSLELGSIYLDSSDKTGVIKLTFEFPSEAMGFDGYVVPFATYTLSYDGQPVLQQ